MFRGQRGLRQLQHLTLEGIEHEVSEMDLEWIAKSCPGLRQLRFLGGDDLPRALWHLDYLDGLTTLQVSVCDPRFKPAAMASALAQLTGLRNLSLSCSMREQPCGWLALAELRALTHLHMDVDDCVTTLSDTVSCCACVACVAVCAARVRGFLGGGRFRAPNPPCRRALRLR
jgi:hypothetical protein